MAKVAGVKVKKKAVRAKRRGSEWDAVPVTTWHKAHYHIHYLMESKSWGNKVRDYIKDNYDKNIVAAINKLPNWKIDGKSHWATVVHLTNVKPELVHPDYAGKLDLYINGLAEEGALIVKEDKEEETAKKNVYIPTIQERILEQAQDAVEDIDEWLDGFISDQDNFDPKGFDFKTHFTKRGVTQAHARKMKKFYTDALQDFQDLERMPTAGQLKKMDEHTQDMWAQLKEGYAHIKKKDIKNYTTAIEELQAALDYIIDTAKATRKTRKPKAKSATKLVEKLKFLQTDDKYKLASIDPSTIVGAAELWVFNIKTRKLGKYIAQEHQTLQVKGTTIQFFDEKRSVQKTLRKPADQLKEFKSAGKVALRKFLEDIPTTDTKLNGRINPDTILLKVS
jgi:hypothetical protein